SFSSSPRPALGAPYRARRSRWGNDRRGRASLWSLSSSPCSLTAALGSASFLLQQNPAAPRDGFLRDLGKLVQQPWQCHFQAHAVVVDLNIPGRRLAQSAHLEIETIAGPGFLIDLQDREAFGSLAERRLDPAQ